MVCFPSEPLDSRLFLHFHLAAVTICSTYIVCRKPHHTRSQQIYEAKSSFVFISAARRVSPYNTSTCFRSSPLRHSLGKTKQKMGEKKTKPCCYGWVGSVYFCSGVLSLPSWLAEFARFPHMWFGTEENSHPLLEGGCEGCLGQIFTLNSRGVIRHRRCLLSEVTRRLCLQKSSFHVPLCMQQSNCKEGKGFNCGRKQHKKYTQKGQACEYSACGVEDFRSRFYCPGLCHLGFARSLRGFCVLLPSLLAMLAACKCLFEFLLG